MKSWKKQLSAELDRTAPDLKEEIKNYPIITENRLENMTEQSGNALIVRRVGIGSACAAVLIALVLVLMGMFGVFDKPKFSDVDRFVFTLEINPAVAFVTDKNGNVKSVNALNEDADVVLSDENTLGKIQNASLNDAIVAYTDGAARLGYLALNAEKTAVRLSGSSEAGAELFDGASESLQAYFRENGIYAAVVRSEIVPEELCERLNIPRTDSLQELSETLEGLAVCFGEHIDTSVSAEKLQELHKDYIVNSQVLEYVKSELFENIDSVVESAEMLLKIALKNFNITISPNNPCGLLSDYWTVKGSYKGSYGKEFGALMNETETLINEYEKEFGVSINSSEELNEAIEIYSSLLGVKLEELFYSSITQGGFLDLFSSLTLDSFRESAERYIGVLKNIGYKTDELESLLTVPETAEEYIIQYRTVLNEIYNSKAESYRESYGRHRDEISEKEYGDFINEIISEYGSLENYWDKK